MPADVLVITNIFLTAIAFIFIVMAGEDIFDYKRAGGGTPRAAPGYIAL